MLLVVDNVSVYLKDLLSCINSLSPFNLLRYDNISINELDNYDGIILSGRVSNNKVMNAINTKIVRYSLDHDKPLLGICYGAEIIALSLGGSIRKMNKHIQGKLDVSVNCINPLTEKKRISVFESHNYCIASPSEEFISIASSENSFYEMIMHKNKKIFGVQFHPEVSGEDGIEILANFARLAR